MVDIMFEAHEYLAYPPGAPLGRQARQLTEAVPRAALLLVNLYALCLPPAAPQRTRLASLIGEEEVQRREHILAERLLPMMRAARGIGVPIIYAADSAPRIYLGQSQFGEVQRSHLGFDPEQLFVEARNDSHEYLPGDPPLIAYAPEVAPQECDYYIRKWVYSAFYMTWLDRLLRNLATRTLFCAGFNGDSDLWCTMLDGHWLGYRIVLLDDAFAAIEVPATEPVMPFTRRLVHYAENCLGYTCASAEFLRACETIQ